MKSFILVLQLLTRLSINPNLKFDEEDYLKGTIYFPLVGLIIGMFIVSFYYIGFKLSGELMAAIFAVITEIVITRGVNIKGLASTFDGIYSNKSKDRILEIMARSSLGTNGTVALFALLTLKLILIINLRISIVYPLLLLMPVISRLNLVFACRLAKPARKQAMANIFIDRVNTKQFIIALAITTIFSLIVIKIFPAILLLLLFVVWYVKHISSKIDGMSGETLGALCELSEIIFLIVMGVLLI